MQKPLMKVPKGMTTHLPEAASRHRYIEESVLSVFSKWGYREVITPVFEYLDILSLGMSESLLQKSYKFVDRDSGRLMILRPDMTPQIARMAAGNLFEEPKPFRLCYRGNVFRYEESHAGRERENFQVGGELIGPDSSQADSEVISLAAECLQGMGLRNFKISLGHAGFLRGILSGLSPAVDQQMQKAIAKRDLSRIDEILEGESKALNALKKILRKVPYFLGGKEILEEAMKSLEGLNVPEAKEAVVNLQDVYRMLCLYGYEDSILVDLGEVRDMDYYTGIFFEIFSTGVGHPLGRGGRYNRLLGKFGVECPSTGFALEVETLMRVMEKEGTFPRSKGVDFLIADYSRNKDLGISLFRSLRLLNYRVATEMMGRTLEEVIVYARDTDAKEILVLGLADLRKGQLLCINPTADQRKTWSTREFLDHYGPC